MPSRTCWGTGPPDAVVRSLPNAAPNRCKPNTVKIPRTRYMQRRRGVDMHVMRGFALAAGVLGLVALSALPARAAEITPASGEIAAGYSYLNDSTSSTSFPAGWFFSAGAHINEGFAVVGDISGNYKSETASAGGVTVTGSAKVHTFLAGPRMMGRAGPLAFYGQFLVGAATMTGGVSATGVGPSL